MAGLTLTGFEIKRYEDVVSSMQDRARTAYGQDVDLSEDSVLGRLINNVAIEIAEMWELAEAINSSDNPSEAEGQQLDDCVDLVGIARLDSAPTTVWCEFTGDSGTVIPLGHTVSKSLTKKQFTVLNSDTISTTLCSGFKVSVSTVANTTLYTITINGNDVSYISDGSATNLEIAAGLKSAFDAIVALTDIATCTNNGDGTLQVSLLSSLLTGSTRLSATVTANLTAVKQTMAIECECTEDGPNVVNPSDIDTIETPLSGLDSVTNRIEGVIGRNVETDTELRVRRILSLNRASAATKDAVRARVLDVAGVTDVYVFENTDLTTDIDGRPGKSFEVIVSGGDDQDIADAIWAVKPVGIETTNRGSAPGVNVVDAGGFTQTVYFSRPVSLPIYVEVDYTLFSEEDFPIDGETQIANLVVEYGNAIGIGKDVIPKRFFGSIYGIEGIDDVVVRVSTDGISYQTTKLTVGAFQIPAFALARVTVTQV